MPPTWPNELHSRLGAPVRLRGITVYHDFPWTDLFPDERTQFKNGMSLAQLAIDNTPSGKKPALLLTVDDDEPERPIETDDEYVVVVRIRQYLVEAGADAAASYYAHGLRKRLAQLSALEDIAQSPELVQSFLEDHLTIDMIESWARAQSERRDALKSIAGQADGLAEIPAERVIEALRSMREVPSDVWLALVELLPELMDDEARRVLLGYITADPNGRRTASEAIGARIADRIADTRDAIGEYEALLRSPDATETSLQRFIENHPWMVGLDYVSVRERRAIPRGQLDFLLERYDGFYDILELKSPNDVIVACDPPAGDMPPSANTFRLGPALANALAQVHVYRDSLTTESGTVERLWGLANSRDPRLIIVIGQLSTMSDDCQRVLEQLNLSLHRVEIMPYDVLGRRAEGWLANIERYLAVDAKVS